MFLDPEEILNQLEIKNNMLAAEFGCGSGGFTLPLAKRLSQGLVWAIDILEGPLSVLKSRCILEKINNIKIIKGDIEREKGSTIPDSSLDIVVIPNVLFQSENKNAIIKEADRVLKNRGILLVIDWLSGVSSGPEGERVSVVGLKEITQKLELKFEKEIDAGKYHFGLIFRK